MPCSCIEKVNEAFGPMNGEIATRFTLDQSGALQTMLLTVEKKNRRGKKPPGLLAKFCPICGTAYMPPETKPMEAADA